MTVEWTISCDDNGVVVRRAEADETFELHRDERCCHDLTADDIDVLMFSCELDAGGMLPWVVPTDETDVIARTTPLHRSEMC